MRSQNIEETCWSTTIDGTKTEFDYIDCHLLCTLHTPCAELGGLTYVPSEEIMLGATETFGDVANLDTAIDRSKEKLELAGLISVKERSGVQASLTKTGMVIAKRLLAHFASNTPILTLFAACNQTLSAYEWTTKPFPTE